MPLIWWGAGGLLITLGILFVVNSNRLTTIVTTKTGLGRSFPYHIQVFATRYEKKADNLVWYLRRRGYLGAYKKEAFSRKFGTIWDVRVSGFDTWNSPESLAALEDIKGMTYLGETPFTSARIRYVSTC